ncbi:MAG: flavin reductase family protein [Dehalococcoidales bacterium]|nr:MAG: flavin reductase family protein [Dehalococcoidales bacterium]
MKKVKMNPSRWMYPRPTLLVGANVDGKANFMAVGGGGVTNADPPMIGVPIRHHQYTLQGIKQNFTFSINTPSADLIRETDYCGIVSGRTTDKVKDCGFTVFYGDLGTAPLIEQCPLNLECKVVSITDLGIHAFVIGEVKETYINEECLADNKPDIRKINPMVFNLESGEYALIGEVIGKAFNIGRELKGV